MDDDRPIQYAENKFFSELGTGKGNNIKNHIYMDLTIWTVPVVVVFTKCEALEVKAVEDLEEKGYDYDWAVENAQKYADENLKTIHMTLKEKQYPPKGHVYLQGKPMVWEHSSNNANHCLELEKPEKQCDELVECTAGVLDSDILQALFISTQQNSLELAMKYSLRWLVLISVNDSI